ncbi:MAG: TIGR03619 family F420-dependent LLM class oxidoreductase [Nitrososphaerales archaeon]
MSKGRLSLGLLLPTSAHKGTPKFSKILEMASIAEEAGFGSLWVGDSILRARIEALMTLAAVAARTERVKLGTATLLLPIRSPVLVAQMVAALDHASGGRVVLGVAPGGDDAKSEFEACGVPFEHRGRRMDEAIGVLRLLWTKDDVSFSGEFYNLSGVTLDPKPIQKPCPDIWVGGASKRTFKRVAELADGWIPFDIPPEEYGQNWSRISQLAKEQSRDLSEIHPAVYIYTNLKPEGGPVEAGEAFYLGGMHESTLSTHGRKQTYTTTDELLEKIDRYAELGVKTLILRFAARDPMGQLKACVKHVLPSI